MRILLLSNYYPPCDQGWGYMQLCEEVADSLAAREHEITVLTSVRCDGLDVPRSYPVHRLLTIDPNWASHHSVVRQFFIGRRRRDQVAVDHLLSVVERFRPEVVFIWHAIGLPRVLLRTCEQIAPSAYYLAGYLPELPDEYIDYWQALPRNAVSRWLKRPLARVALTMLRREGKPVSLKYENVACVSSYVRNRLVDQGLIPSDSEVIHNGVDLSVFRPTQPVRQFADCKTLQCVVAGRIVRDKGIHTAIEALAILKSTNYRIQLSVLGDGSSEYRAELEARVIANGLGDVVSFRPAVSRDSMPEVLEQFDVLILPSEYEEPIARSMQEAMAMGLLVVGTTTGGSGELLVHNQTGLVFDSGDAASLAQQLAELIGDPSRASRLALAGQASVRECFGIEHTVAKVEIFLQRIVGIQ